MMELIGSVTGTASYSTNGLPPLKERLDPISILAMCALLRFKEAGSRITYCSNLSVYIQEPSKYRIKEYSVLPALRRLYGQSRDDTDIVEWAIRTAASWHQPQDEDKADYQILFEHANEGLEPLSLTYEEKNSTVTAEGIRGWQRLITTVTTEGTAPAEELTQVAVRIKNLWSRADIDYINALLTQMNVKQAEVPVTQELKCQDEIEQLESLVSQKTKRLGKIWQCQAERNQ